MLTDDVKQDIQSAYRLFLERTGFTPRASQRQMIGAIATRLAFSRPLENIIAVEAGTGTGKTLAYLLAAVPVARHLGKHLVISTGTIALQEQLIYKDIPDVLAHTDLSFGYSLVKGRGRYLCQLRLDNLLVNASEPDQVSLYLDGLSQALPGDSLQLYRQMDEALKEGEWDGDRDAWPDAVTEIDWQPLTSDRYQCLGRNCAHVNQCAFFRARDQREDNLVYVANHDLVLADLALGGGAVLPPVEECIYIFDEAHHLGDKARQHFSARLRLQSLVQFLGNVMALCARFADEFTECDVAVRLVGDISAQCNQSAEISAQAYGFLIELWSESERESEDNLDYRFEFGRIEPRLGEYMGDLFRPLSQAALKTSKLIERLDELRADDDANDLNSKIDTWYSLPGQWLARFEAGADLCERYRSALGSEAVLGQDDQRANFARWCRYYPKQQDLELFAAPILAGDMLYDSLWSQCAGAALVSATLRTLGSFERLRQRAGLPDEFESLALPSPFRFQDNAVLHIPKEAADPRDTNAHDTYILDTLPKRLDIKKGNLVLFSSARQMDWVFDHLATDWQKQVLVQGSRSKQKLIETHKSRIDDGRGSTLFGLASFAEGLDLAGHYCEHVVIAKLPFSVPTDPEAEALAEWIEAHGGNAFRDMSLADASLRLVQAVGRLLRSDQDRGQITVMDNRLLTKAYGKQLLADLPPMPIVYD